MLGALRKARRIPAHAWQCCQRCSLGMRLRARYQLQIRKCHFGFLGSTLGAQGGGERRWTQAQQKQSLNQNNIETKLLDCFLERERNNYK